MNRYLWLLLALAVTGRAANFPDTSTDGQVIVNSNNTSAGSSSLRWSFTNTRLTVGPTGTGSRVDVEGATPAWRLYAGGNPATSYSRLEGFWDSGAQTYYLREIVSGSNAIPFVVGINSGATLTFNTDGSALHSGSLGLSGTTNRLTIVSNQLYLDGVPVTSTASAPVNNFYATNIFTQNGSHNTLIVTQQLTLSFLKTNVLATTASGSVTSAVYGSGISWDPATLTLSASGSGSSALTFNTLAYSGTNVTVDCSLGDTNGAAYKLNLTNAAFFATPTSVPTTAKGFQIWFQQPSTGTVVVSWTNGSYKFPGGVQPVIDTNNSAVTVVTFATGPFTNSLLNFIGITPQLQ